MREFSGKGLMADTYTHPLKPWRVVAAFIAAPLTPTLLFGGPLTLADLETGGGTAMIIFLFRRVSDREAEVFR